MSVKEVERKPRRDTSDDIEAAPPMSAELRLVRAVIAQAMADIGMRHQYLTERDKASNKDYWLLHHRELEQSLDAVLWLIDRSERPYSLAWYCDAAGIPWRPTELKERFKLDLLAIRCALARQCPSHLKSRPTRLKKAA